MYRVRRFFQWIIKSCQYAWFLRHDYDWDYEYLLDLMKFKMQRMANTIENNDLIEGNKRVAKQLRYSCYLIDRYQGSEDYNKAYAAFVERWGEVTYEWEDIGFVGNEKLSRLETKFGKAGCTEEEMLAQEDLRKLYRADGQINQQLLNRLFKHTRTYLEGWWD